MGLFFGKYAIFAFSLIPAAVYAALLAYLGVQHALLVKDLVRKLDFVIPVFMGAVAFLTSNLLLALALGYIISLIYQRTGLALYSNVNFN